MTENNVSQSPRRINDQLGRRAGLIFTGVGLMVFILGAKPDWFGLNISEAIGVVQIGVFSFGLLLIGLGGTFALHSLWPPHWRSIPADIGLRLAWSGVVMAIISGMADVLGLGTRPLSSSFTFFGYWQARGVVIGQVLMLIGFFMMIPFQSEFPPPPQEQQEDSEIGLQEEGQVHTSPYEEKVQINITIDEG